MRVYLMQHGKPVPKEEDPDQPLSDQGKADVGRVGEFLTKSGVKVEEALHSGKTRARQTAEAIVSHLAPGLEAIEKAGLSPMDLGKLASLLITGDEGVPVVSFQQGGVVCLEKDEEGGWSVAWMVVPDIIKGSV
jgi:phosphohistidine phosphatase